MGTTLPGWQREPLATRASYTHTPDPVTAAGYTGATPGLTGTAPQERRAEHVPHAPVCVSTVPVAQGRNRPLAGARNHFAPGGSRELHRVGCPSPSPESEPCTMWHQQPGAARSLAGGGCRPGEGTGRGSCMVTGWGRVQAGGAPWSLAGGGCRPGVLHGHWPGEVQAGGAARSLAGGGYRPGELHGHWLGEGAGRGSCMVTGRGRVQAGGAARSLARGGCRPGELHGHWLGEGTGRGSCMVTGWGRVQAGGAARSLAGGGCRPGVLHGHWPGEGAGRGSCTVTGWGRVQAGGAARSLAGGGCRWGCWRAQGAAVTHFQEG
ncbi:unnamed protein product [Caretta caretta]